MDFLKRVHGFLEVFRGEHSEWNKAFALENGIM